ncbi:peptidoglycan-binding protein [Actinomadura vinacea]|uniref:Peptidoglycan-binding protein n=1 Tax=Actinomadura vinacea TaxID=115336 RepID=A0ABN3IV43_9ACTN
MNRTRAAALSAAGVVVVAGGGLATAGLGGGDRPAAARTALPPDTAAVERTTLVETKEVDGTLGYGSPRPVPGAGKGTVTWLPKPGDRIARGRPAYKVDNRPVPLLYGSLPLYRALSEGKEGPDVEQLERNLRALGYTGFTVDDSFDSGTTAAVERWQDDLGVPETGAVSPGSVLVAAGEIRVAERKATVGDRLGGAVLTYTGTDRRVSVDLDVQHQRLAKKGAQVEIELPEGDTVKGTITGVGRVATEAQGDDKPATVAVTVAVRGQSSLGSYDKAPVTVRLTADRVPDVLAVPVSALLARPGGGYAVQVVEGGRVREVAVETGVFSGGRVEVSGAGLAEGMKVGIPK